MSELKDTLKSINESLRALKLDEIEATLIVRVSVPADEPGWRRYLGNDPSPLDFLARHDRITIHPDHPSWFRPIAQETSDET